ncbi:MAG: GAF domain-containing protein [Actinomycetales bacterium]
MPSSESGTGDPRVRERSVNRVHQPGGERPRPQVAESWRRAQASGLDPSADPSNQPLPESEREHRRATSGLEPLIPGLRANLDPVLRMGYLLVITDPQARVLWRFGDPGSRRRADQLGFVSGADWSESNVGTNAIGTTVVLGDPVHIRGPEHFADSHAAWGCAAAPLVDPWTGKVLGVIDVSGASRQLNPAAMALVTMAAQLAGHELLERHRGRLDRLRQRAAPLVAALGGQAVAVDLAGHVAAAIGLSAPDRVHLPTGLAAGPVRLAELGAGHAEPLPGGWLIRIDPDEACEATSALVILDGVPRLLVNTPGGQWTHDLTRRHAEILLALVAAGPIGLTGPQLGAAVFGEAAPLVTVRAEISRLRKALGAVLQARPYRIAAGVSVQVRLPADGWTLLPGSTAPVVSRIRELHRPGTQDWTRCLEALEE